MNLYELQLKENLRAGWSSHARSCRYFTAQGSAIAAVTAIKKQLNGKGLLAILSAVTVRTNLLASDWIKLLEADAPGDRCELTAVDLITDRKELRRWDIAGKPEEG